MADVGPVPSPVAVLLARWGHAGAEGAEVQPLGWLLEPGSAQPQPQPGGCSPRVLSGV